MLQINIYSNTNYYKHILDKKEPSICYFINVFVYDIISKKGKYMSKLVRIKGNQLIAIKDSIKITPEDKQLFLTKDYRFFDSKMVDVPTSIVLIAMFNKCPYASSEFINEVGVSAPEFVVDDNYIYICPIYSVETVRIPLLLQRAGLKIKKEKRIAYLASSNNTEYPYNIVNKDGSLFEPEVSGVANDLEIIIYDEVLALTKDEYNTYLRTEQLVKSGKLKEITNDDLCLWALVDAFQSENKKEKIDVVFHEIKHAKNKIIKFDYIFENPDLKFSAIDIYNIQKDDELSAKIEEVIQAINAYNQSENKNDFSMFESFYPLQQLLHVKPKSEFLKLLSDIPSVVKIICADWHKNYGTYYDAQFIQNTSVDMNQLPIRCFATDTDGSDYNKIRSLMFTYSVYNPTTRTYINMDLSQYLKQPPISKETQNIIRKMYTDIIVKKRKLHLKHYSDVVNQLVIQDAEQEYKKTVLDTEYRKTLAVLQSRGIDYISCLDYIPPQSMSQQDIASQTTETEPKKQDLQTHKAPKVVFGNAMVAVRKMIDRMSKWLHKNKTNFNNRSDYE